ncbi:UDP-N-acetylglucosamine 2-epimerase (non-hydrolyzing) [Candidatus Woesearchaeota archaeon]|nr:UDP-N-acetylglucosamine 2-epimerase (non-hydrolyzing) [Candidatus Woesearchaeota archaeon]
MKIVTILGTRPEITKLSPLISLLDKEFEHILIHTGQHYDYNMDMIFFEELHLKKPNYLLGVGSHAQGKQTALILEKIEEILIHEKPALVIILGDTNTTLSGALAAAKLHISLMHVEAGCRSFNKQMPEEINRIVADHLSDYLIAPDEVSVKNLLSEGFSPEKIFAFGSTVFDAVLRNKDIANTSLLGDLFLIKDNYLLVTLHRAENTDDILRLKSIIEGLNKLAEFTTLVFPIHPRTKKFIQVNNIAVSPKIKVIEPQSYLHFLGLLSNCKFCLSDSGGVQEEALACNIPCLILRNETEWIRVVEAGKNLLVGTETEKIFSAAKELLDHPEKLSQIKEKRYDFAEGASSKILHFILKVRDGLLLKMDELTNKNLQQ